MEEKDIVAKNLMKYRKQAGFSQLDLAKKLNYSNKNISKWENGETTPSIFVLNQIAQLYGIKVDDFLSISQEDANQEPTAPRIDDRRKLIFRIGMLLLANAIVYAVGTALIYALHYVNIADFNKYLIYLYLSPLSFLSVTIFIRVLCKFVDPISLSIFGWLICLGIYLSFINIPYIAFVFALGAAYEFILIFMVLLLNIKLFNKRPKWLKSLLNNHNK